MPSQDASLDINRNAKRMLAVLAAIGYQASTLAMAVCYQDGSDGFPLMTPIDPTTGLPQCAKGFTCPGFDPLDSNTYPRYCPPTQECSYTRAMGNRCYMPQGSLEPYVCPPGYYCPDATSVIICPEGHYCPMAAYEPLPCLSPSYCPEGTVQQLYFGGIIFMVALFFAVFVLMLLYNGVLNRSRLPSDYSTSAAMRLRRHAIIPQVEEAQEDEDEPEEDAHPLPKSPTNHFESCSDQQIRMTQFPEERSFGHGGHRRSGEVSPNEDYHHSNRHHHQRQISGSHGASYGYKASAGSYTVSLTRPQGAFASSTTGQGFAQRMASISTDQPYRESLIMNPMISTPTNGAEASPYDFNTVEPAEPFANDDEEGGQWQNGHEPAMSKPATQLLAGAFRRARGTNRPLHIKFEDLRVLAPLRQQPGSVKFTSNAGNNRIEVLKGVNGELAPSRVTAVLGPGGCGKTVLLNTLVGRLPSDWSHTGHLSINNETSPSAFARLRPMMGYVSQVERLHKELTVAENLYYNAQIRLPREWTDVERKYLMAAIIDSLKLSKQKDMPIGDEETRGISGGQRRRTHIGVELAGAPWCLVLDEPTNGLDSTTALEVCSCLSAIATGADLTVVMTISQPRVEIWNALDDVLILAKGGRTVYQGKQKYAERFFSHFYAVEFKPDSNPADVIIDEVSSRGGELADMWEMFRQTGQTGLQSDDEEDTDFVDAVSNGNRVKAQALVDNDPAASYDGQSSIVGPDGKKMVQKKRSKKSKKRKQRLAIKYERASFLKQIYFIHNRSIAKQLSDIRPFVVEQVVNLLVAAVLGVSLRTMEPHWSYKHYQLAGTIVDPILPQVFMYASMALGLVCATPGLNVFLNDRDTYFREAASGFSKPAYYLGSILASQIRIFITAMTFTAVFHIVPRLYTPYWSLFLPMYLNALCSYALGGIAAMHFEPSTAPLVSYLAVIFAGCLSGFIKFPMFMKYLSYEFYNSALLQRVFVNPYDYIYNTTTELYGWPEFAGAFGFCVGMMLAYFVVFHLIGFILMVALKRDKQR